MTIARVLTAPFRALGYVSRALFGSVRWEPAPWQRRVGAFVAARPWQVAGSVLGVALIAAVAAWWITRPKPVDPAALTVGIDAPELTVYSETPPTVDTLVVTFSGSAAPIERVGEAATGVALEPPLAGEWKWASDQRLEFKPASDWPVGQRFRIRFDLPTAFAPNTKLADDKLELASAPFRAELASSEFYQDPEDPTLKKGAYEFRFSHPVDATTFEPLLALAMVDGAGTKQEPPGLTISYDEKQLKAYVQTKPLTVPENGGALALTLKPGTKSALGGPAAEDEVKGHVALPSLYSVRVESVSANLVDNERFEPEQVIVLEMNDAVKDQDVAKLLTLHLLPERNPKLKPEEQSVPYGWSASEVDEKLLAQSERLTLVPLPAEREYVQVHSFRYQAPPGRYVYVRLPRGLRSFGGFKMGEAYSEVLSVPDYPELLRFVGDGALLTLKGERRITTVARNVPGLKLEVARVLPTQLQHLVKYNSGSYGTPTFYQVEADSLTERFVKRVALPHDDPSRTHYEGIDLGEYFTDDRHGVFLLSLYRDDPDVQETGESDYVPEPIDQRLVVLTDLGVIAKTVLDGSRHVFVQSIANGTPVAGATVAVVARNGERIVERTTDADGTTTIPSLTGFKREKQPVMLAVIDGADLSFLPLEDWSRRLDTSRFDVGGEINAADPGDLKAYLFSDRGLYRPGDTIHLGLIVRTASWAGTLAGVPLELVLTDPRGSVAKRERLALGDVGFETVEHTPEETAPTGNWDATLYLVGPNDELTSLGTTTVSVREFLPDRLKVRATLSSESVDGWVRPEELSAIVNVQNLFGTPAQERRVKARLLLQTGLPAFRKFPEHRFHDPQNAEQGYSESLDDGETDAEGNVEFALGLEKYERATFRLRFLAEAFEAGAGRGVAADTSALVSSNDFLVGIRVLDPLDYVQRGAKRAVNVVAIGPDGDSIAKDGLRAVLIERKWVSVLTKQDSGLFKYVSQLRLETKRGDALAIPAGGADVPLPTDAPGDYTLEIRDASDVLINSVGFSVAGAANVTRSLDRNAELQLTLSKGDYAPGEDVEISVRAPYTGSGLVTIERDKVYAHAWFRADTTSSVQTIRVPEGLEGNAYVHVQFLRDPQSDEIFMSPLSYGIAPFSIDRAARRLAPRLEVPAKVKPGGVAAFTLSVDEPARAVVFAVDEGILQVARYQLGDPLDHFFRKKMLQVDTAQILDLVLPEFGKLAGMAAPGGDAEGALAKHLNPFKRKGDKPAVFWSGLIDLEASHTFEYTVPESFNGSLRVMAVAVASQRIGVAQESTLVRGDFVLTPNVPTQVAPGDEFDVTVGVANTIDPAPAEALPIAVKLLLPPSLTAVGDTTKTLGIAGGNEGSATFRVKAGDALGAPVLQFAAESGAKYRAARSIDVSVRPNVAYRHELTVGHAEKPVSIAPLREMYDEHAKRHAAASISPLVVVGGLAAYLDDFPHYCTEQLLSQAIPALVFARRPELGSVQRTQPGDAFAGIVDVLRSRQSSGGGFGLWVATPDPQPFVSAYAGLYLVEARDRDFAVPEDLMTATNDYLAGLAADAGQSDLAGLRTRALAVYLLTRQGRTTTNLLAGVHQQLEKNAPKAWQRDAAAALLAASYQLLKQTKVAAQLVDGPLDRLEDPKLAITPDHYYYYDDGIASAWTVYLVAKHFPAERERLTPAVLGRLIEPAKRGWHNTLSSGLTVLALDAHASSGGTVPLPTLAYVAAGKDAKAQPFGDANGIIRAGAFPGTAQSVVVTPPAEAPAWYAVSQGGFDRKLPASTQSKGIELIRDYLGADDEPLAALTVGEEITVRLRLRALGGDARGNIAIVDLLPGAFEAVVQQAPLAEDADGTTPPPAATLALPGSTMSVDYTDVREDRVVVYATATAGVTELRYRIKATAVGKFVVPPPYAESMYQRDIYAQGGPAGSLEVKAPAP